MAITERGGSLRRLFGRLAWFALFWGIGVGAVLLVALAIRSVIL